ncbi:MAG TPA: citrate transporter, partial [Ruminococcaceae bacterium]|nr:citrate transporter [Oscillospiraceae bacterium]
VALITFVPLSLVLLSSFEIKTIIYIVVMQTVAANIGSSLTPVGNPQNLYIFSFYRLAPASFFAVTVPFVLFGGLLIFFIAAFSAKARG